MLGFLSISAETKRGQGTRFSPPPPPPPNVPPPPPPPRGSSDLPPDSAKGLRKRVWSKPSILVFNDVSDVDSAVQTHPTRGDNQNPIHLYAPTS